MLTAIAAVLVVAVASCRDAKQPPVAAMPAIADSADQVLQGVHYLMSSGGIQRAELRADTAYVLDDQTRFDLRNTDVTFTTETGAPQGTMQARRGMYNLRSQVLEGRGDVVVKLVDGRTLRSPHVTYNQLAHLISSDTTYTLTRGSDSQSGIGFSSNESFTRFTCLRNCGGNTSLLLPSK